MLGENPELTCEEIATKLKCNKSTIARSEAWKNRGVLQYQPPKGYMKSSKDNDTYEVDGFAGS